MSGHPESNPRNHASGDVVTPPPVRGSRQLLKPGQIIGNNYEVIEQIGEGGMAIVYKARQISLNRAVAIKALHPRFSRDPDFVERFEAESGALAALSHPNIVTIIDRGAEGDVFYFVMELVDGEDLDQKIIRGVLTRDDWRKVINACGDALEYVHRKGVVHRDIKPSNILVSSEGQIKIGDFGIAHILHGDHMEEETTERSAGPVGTTYYMAPEQMSDPETVDHRADIYSLAVACYKMLVRQLPDGDFEPPSELNNEIPIAVDSVIFQALAPDRDDRHSSARQFCDELLAALKEKSVSIKSIFDYHSSSSGTSSLYSGVDLSSSPKSGSGSARSTDDTDRGSSSKTPAARAATSPRKGSTTAPPRPAAKKAEKTPSKSGLLSDSTSHVRPTSHSAEATTSGRGKLLLLLAGGVLLLAAIAIAGFLIFSSSRQDTPPALMIDDGPIVPMTDAISPALQREYQLEELRRQEEEQLFRSQPEVTPIPRNDDEDIPEYVP